MFFGNVVRKMLRRATRRGRQRPVRAGRLSRCFDSLSLDSHDTDSPNGTIIEV